jgi:hypothetical protein
MQADLCCAHPYIKKSHNPMSPVKAQDVMPRHAIKVLLPLLNNDTQSMPPVSHQDTSSVARAMTRVFSRTQFAWQCSKPGEKGKRVSKSKTFLVLPDTLPGTPRGQADTTWLHDGGLEHASSQHLLNLHAAFVLPATTDHNKQISTGDPAKQRAFEPFIHKRTADKLEEQPSAASVTTASDSEIEIFGCSSAHKRSAATCLKWTEKPSHRRLQETPHPPALPPPHCRAPYVPVCGGGVSQHHARR